MEKRVFRVDRERELAAAGPTDLLELLPAPGGNPLFLPKWLVETLVYGIVHHEFIHLSGPTGSAKSSLLEALHLEPLNFRLLCASLDYPRLPLQIHPVEMAVFEAPGELYQRRSLRRGHTYDERSILVAALEKAAKQSGRAYPLVWLREIGRVHSSTVQGGLLNLMTKSEIILPDGGRLDCRGVAWVADSNYQAEQEGAHTLVALDDALKRRFTINLTMDYLSAGQEVEVLNHLLQEESAWRS